MSINQVQTPSWQQAQGLDTTAELAFAPGFRFGAATAAFQIEGATHEDGRTDSIWDAFCRVRGAVFEGHDGHTATGHYHRMPQDVALMKDLGLETYRFSTSWARIKPDDGPVNPAGMDFYSRLVDELLGAGITPWLTLYHWDLPQSLQEKGGWVNRDTAHRFADYAMNTFDALSDRVRIWTTLNEPWCSSFLSYAGGEHAPGHTDPREAVAAAHHLMLGHGLATRRMREAAATLVGPVPRAGSSADGSAGGSPGTVEPEFQFGITLNFTVADPADPRNPGDVDAARRMDGAFNRIFLDPILRGQYPEDVLADMAHAGIAQNILDGDLEVINTPLDLLGVNFYNGGLVAAPSEDAGPAPLPGRRPTIAGMTSGAAGTGAAGTGASGTGTSATGASAPESPDGLTYLSERGLPRRSPFVGAERLRAVDSGLPRTAMGWEVQPEALQRLLERLHRDYTGAAGIGLVITENGAAYDDVRSPDGSVDDTSTRLAYIDAHLRAVHAAIENGADVRGYLVWSLMDNFEWSFGYSKRFGIVHVDYETLERTPKASALWYRDVARSHVLPALPQDTR